MTDLPNLPNLNGLVELGRRDGVDIRPTLLRVVTDLYVQKPWHSEEEERHFSELALRLIDLVDAPTRALVAEKIAAYPAAPEAVRQRLLRESITLVTPGEAAIAEDLFAGRKGSAEELSELFFAASSEERRLILLNLPYAPLPPAPPPDATAAREAIARLEAAALGHNSDAFARELERALCVSHAQARRLIDDESGEPVVVAAVALGMPAAVLQRILLCLNPAISRSVQRVYDLAVLHEDIERDAALRLVAIWQAERKPEPTAAAAPVARERPVPSANTRARAVPPARPRIRWDEHARARGKADGH